MNQYGKHFIKASEIPEEIAAALKSMAGGLGPLMEAEIRIDTEMVCIPVTRFEELIAEETELRVLARAHENAKYSSDMDVAAGSVFGPREKDAKSGDSHA